MKNIIILTAILTIFNGCALKPVLSPVELVNVDINKDVRAFFEFTDSHSKVIMKNRSGLPGIHHDVNEDNYLPIPFTDYLKQNIVNNLAKSPGFQLMQHKNESDFMIQFELKYFDVYRHTSGSAAAAGILVGGLIGQAMVKEDFRAIINGEVSVLNSVLGDVLCSFSTNVEESIVVGISKTGLLKSRALVGYEDVTEEASSELIKQIIIGLSSCN